MKEKPLLLITMGDPAGVGPEVVLKAIFRGGIAEVCRPVVLGDRRTLEAAARELGLPLKVEEIWSPKEGNFTGEVLNLIPLTTLSTLPKGRPQREGGEAVYRYIVRAVELLMQGEADGLVTAPISKEALRMAGYLWNGHTELLAELSGTTEYAMMLAGPRLRVSLVTTHIPLSEVPRRLTAEKVLTTVRVTYRGLRELFGIKEPRIVVAALNPHGGEGGIFGAEEDEVVVPAVRRAKEEGMEVEGPLPADSLFYYAAQGRWDAVVALYHDQGLIPLKLLHFKEGVNVTLGLPFIRTSPDHGTAYDIAGKGIADPTSMICAVRMAAEMARRRGCRGPS